MLLISIDGMKPEYVLEADQRSLKIPYLRGLVAQGAFARGVVGVWPTVTYPSHTTLLTGVRPSEHGIVNNLEFDPLHRFSDAWYWYTAQIRVPTLWRSAKQSGLVTASIGWPVSVGAADVDYLIPEFWRAAGANEANPTDRDLIAALSRPAGLLEQLSAEAGPYMTGNDTSLDGDRIKTRFARAIIRERHPQLMTLHLSSLDDVEHGQGPFSAGAYATLESIDGLLSELSQEALAVDPKTIVVVVSDHGFTALTHRVHLAIPFLKAGLIDATVDPETHATKVVSWRAEPWAAGGMAAIMLKDPQDAATSTQVGELLHGLEADPDNGIAAVLEPAQIAARGGFPDAAYLVVFKTGYYAGANLSGDLVTEIRESRGGHGFSPDFPEMRASFFAAGRGIAAHRDLGVVDMLQIAPTIAELLGVSLPTAKAAPLKLGRSAAGR